MTKSTFRVIHSCGTKSCWLDGTKDQHNNYIFSNKSYTPEQVEVMDRSIPEHTFNYEDGQGFGSAD